jgi:Bacterial PH domain
MSHDNGVGRPAYIKGVPHPLPPGESVLWEGAPNTRAVATHVFHWRLFAAYFAAMLLLWLVTTESAFGSTEFIAGLGVRVGLSVLVLGIVVTLSRLVASTSWYAITSHRLVLRLGMVFPMSINVPFSILESAGVARFKDGTGQVLLTLTKSNRVAYIALWPHCHVWRFANPQPVLRGLTDAAQVGEILATAVAQAAADQETRVQRSTPRDAAVDSLTIPQPANA